MPQLSSLEARVEAVAKQGRITRQVLEDYPNTEIAAHTIHHMDAIAVDLRTRLIGTHPETVRVQASAVAEAKFPRQTRKNLLKAWLQLDLEAGYLIKRWWLPFVEFDSVVDRDSDWDERTISTQMCPHLPIEQPSAHLDWLARQ